MNDNLGDRMKRYENINRIYLIPKTNTVLRCDGKAFHTLTCNLKKPFDDDFMNDMDETAIYLGENIQNIKFLYVQSDEISAVLTDYDTIKTDSWFDGNIQKISSVSASYATAKFNQLRLMRNINSKLAQFDSRCFTLHSQTEVYNYCLFRQRDATRNSILSVGQANFSNKQLHGKNTDEIQDMLFKEKGINWNDLEPKYKRGRMIIKEEYMKGEAKRTRWIVTDCPIFSQDPNFIYKLLPNNKE